MIPEKLVEFINGTTTMYAGTRDEKMNPWGDFACGATASADGKTITFYIPKKLSDRFMNNARNNGRIAFVVSAPLINETYQFKGSYVTSRESDEKDNSIQDIFMDKLSNYLSTIGYPKEIIRNFQMKPCIAVTFSVDEIFDQAPGPDAGKKLASG